MSDTGDFFDDLAGQEAPKEAEGFADLPAKVWFAVRNITKDDENEKVLPRIQQFESRKNPGVEFFMFKSGLVLAGMEDTPKNSKFDAKYDGRIMFMDAFIQPREDDPSPVSSRMVGLMNCVLSTGVGEEHDTKTEDGRKARREARWQNTLKALRTIANDNGLSPAQYEEAGGTSVFLAGCLVAYMSENECRFLCKSREEKNRDTKEVMGVSGGQFEDYTEKNFANRKVRLFDAEEAGPSGSEAQVGFDFD